MVLRSSPILLRSFEFVEICLIRFLRSQPGLEATGEVWLGRRPLALKHIEATLWPQGRGINRATPRELVHEANFGLAPGPCSRD